MGPSPPPLWMDCSGIFLSVLSSFIFDKLFDEAPRG